ncbi:MAG: hypothetical protein R3C18_13755 [Planctomycetaceae bacterium]
MADKRRVPTPQHEIRTSFLRMLVIVLAYFVISSLLGGASDFAVFLVRVAVFGTLAGGLLLAMPKPNRLIVPTSSDLEIPGIWPRYRASRRDGRMVLAFQLGAGAVFYWIVVEWALMSSQSAPGRAMVYVTDVAVVGAMLLLALWIWNEPFLRSEGLLTVSPDGLLFTSFPDTSFPNLIPWTDLKKSEIVEHRGWKGAVELALWHRPRRRVLTLRLPQTISDEDLDSLDKLLNTYLEQSEQQRPIKAPEPKRQFHRLLERLGKNKEESESPDGLLAPEPEKKVLELTEDQFLELVIEDAPPVDIADYEVPGDTEPTADLPYDEGERPDHQP